MAVNQTGPDKAVASRMQVRKRNGDTEPVERSERRSLVRRRRLREEPDLLGSAHQYHIEHRIIEAYMKELRDKSELAVDAETSSRRL